MREKIEAFISAWEIKSKKAMYLDDRLHPKIKVPLIDGIMAIIESEIKQEKPKRGKAKA